MTPNRVNRAHWPTKENIVYMCLFGSVHGGKCGILIFFILDLFLGSKFLDSQVPRIPKSHMLTVSHMYIVKNRQPIAYHFLNCHMLEQCLLCRWMG